MSFELISGRVHSGLPGDDDGYQGNQALGEVELGSGTVATWRGGEIEGRISVGSNASLIIVGTDFRDGLDQPVEGPLCTTPGIGCIGTLSGTLESGEKFTNDYSVSSGGEVALVPAPTALASTCAAGATLAMLAARRRRRAAHWQAAEEPLPSRGTHLARSGVLPQPVSSRSPSGDSCPHSCSSAYWCRSSTPSEPARSP